MILPIDLAIALSVIVLISIAMAWLGAKSSLNWSYALAIIAVAVLLLYALWLGDNLILARILPLADVIAWGNLQTPAMAILAGIAWVRFKGPAWQKWVFVGALVSIGTWRLVEPYVGHRPALGPSHWSHGICVQTTKSTCSAAAAATLLSQAGIASSEAEMADLCLTLDDGTTALGIYRGLKIKTAGTKWKIIVLPSSPSELKSDLLPAILTITDPNVPGGLHSVVVFRFVDKTHAEIGDPFTGGRQRWTLSALSRADCGGFALVDDSQKP